jgi:capsular exopolysaccharide synthesis family protein
MTADKGVRRLLVTSPSPQEGKTTVAANLAIVMAQSGLKVLIVDTDMRRPRVHKAFQINRPVKGISTMILGETELHDSVVHTVIPNLDILPCGPTPPNPSELLHTAAFASIMREISNNYDRVIFDSPPIGVVTDAAIISKMVDGTVLIVKSLKTTKDSASHAISVLKDIDSEILGAVLNGLDLNNRKYGRYYYYYYNKYGYYYGEDTKDGSGKKA